ncbi:uncharacterized protein LOC116831274 isoform X3 [Chelonoidis abingdonii]|uniref:uncharacterized protein LOC116831274 isoform X3 n=1 Tax=Chelonoidis abingdonii TaxID=106734 RepID=UPI003F492BC1
MVKTFVPANLITSDGARLAAMETSWDSSLHSWAGPTPAVIQATMYSKAARQAEETREELEKIQARIDHVIQAYEHSEQVSSAQQAATEIVEDVEQLVAVLGDPVKKKRYQQQVTVFIVGYQESCGQRNSLLSQLQEFFSCSAELGLGLESHSLPDDFPVHMGDMAGKRRLQGLEQESGAQRAHLEAELRSRDSCIAELDRFLQEKMWLQRDVATQCSDCAPSNPAACPGGLLPSGTGAAEEGPPAGRELGEGLAESMVRPEEGFPNPEDTPGPQPVGGPVAHSAVLGLGVLAGPAGGRREAGKEEEDAEGEPATHPAGGERSPSWGTAVENGTVQTPEASATCELLARRLAALEAELAAAQLQNREDAEHWERRCRTMAAKWEEERQRLLQHTWHPVEEAQHLETMRSAEMVQHLEISQMGHPMKQVAMGQPAQGGETAQQVEKVLQILPMQQVQPMQQGALVQLVQPVELVQQTQPVPQEQLAERVETAPKMFAAGSQLTLQARGFPELTLAPTPAGVAAPSPGPTRHGGAPRSGASPDALSQSQGGATPAPAAGCRGADSRVVAFIESLRAGLMAKELHILARLLDGPCGGLMTVTPEDAAGAEIHTLLENATLVFYSLLEGISDNDKMLLQPQNMMSDQGGAAAPALGKGIAVGGAGPLALDQHPVGGHSSHAVPLTQGRLMSAGRGLSPRSEPGSAGAKRRAPRVLFTQQDEQHNRQVLNQGVCRGQVPWGLYQDASLLMGGFRWLRRQRFEGLVRGYLAHVRMKEAEETLEQLQGSCGCVMVQSALGRLQALRQQRLQCWRGERCRSWARQLQLAELLSETLRRVEERSGLFVIQPVLPWAGR